MKTQEHWIIRHKLTKEQWTASSSKSGWKKSGHAKNAWIGSFDIISGGHSRLLFDEQDDYELINIYADYETLPKEDIQKNIHEAKLQYLDDLIENATMNKQGLVVLFLTTERMKLGGDV